MNKIILFFLCFCSLYASAQPDPPPPPACLVYSIISIPSHDTTVCLNGANLHLQGDTTNSTFSGPHVVNGIFSPTAVGTYRIFYTNPDTCIKPDSVDITVVGPPTVPGVITGPSVVCNSEFSSNFAINPVAGASGYNWLYTPVGIDGSNQGTTAAINWITSAPYCGPVTISVAAVNACGNSAPQTYTFNLVCAPAPVITASGPYCMSADTFHLTASIPGGTWGGNCVTTDGVFTPSFLGNCAVIYNVSDNGCQGSTLATLVVNMPQQVSITAPPTLCINANPLQLTGTPAGGTFSPSATFVPQTPGVQTITYTVNGAYGCSGVASTDIDVLPLPTANFGWQQTDCKTLCFGDQSLNSFSWSWDFGDGETGTSLNSCHSYTIVPGTYCVTQRATNACGTHDTTICIYLECTGIAEDAANTISIYPNPATDILTINTANLQNIQVELFDVSGRKLLQQNVVNSVSTIDIATLNNGLYIARITNKNGTLLKTERIAIVR